MTVRTRGPGLFAAVLFAFALPLSAAQAREITPAKALDALLAEQWEYTLRESPEFATILGDYRYNDRWSDASPQAIARQQREAAKFLRRFEAIDATQLDTVQALNRQLMVAKLRDQLKSIELKLYEMPLDQFNGAQLQYPQFAAYVPTDTVRQYEDYLKRLKAIPHQIDGVIAMSRLGLRDGLIQPKYLLEKVATQCESIAEPAAAGSAFALPVQKFPERMPKAEQQRLRKAILAAIDTQVRPAYRRLAAFVRDDYAPHGRTEPGLWSLPNGDALYRFAIHSQTTTDMDPAQIHEIGLAEVSRIEAEQAAIAKQLGYADLAGFRQALKTDPKTFATSREQILELYRKYIGQMQPELPKLFGLLPKTPLEVLPVQTYREKEAAGAEYNQGTPDGSRPGKVYVNTGDFKDRSLLTIESTAYHEGVPGHHMQIAIAQTLPGLPPFRQQSSYNAYAEGWALYSERLGKEVGFYKDPYSDFGRLSDELLRANRLVLDTGVHYKHWTRQQMVDWFHAHSSDDEPDLQSETDRYIAWPAQALGYKLGQLKILALREDSKKVLGDRFDIRAFHDAILDGGALPLDVLEQRIKAWQQAQLARR